MKLNPYDIDIQPEELARRDTGDRSPRVYFMLGTNGFIYILFFDPFHELNPMVK